MAFPLAHPAAILPLKRFCPRFLNFTALVIGSIVPDVAYIFGARTWHYMQWDWWSHHFNGIFYFSLPVGLLMFVLFHAFRKPLVNLLPTYQQSLFLPVCRQPIPNPLIILCSLFLGAWSHLGWDSFTHPYGWFSLHYRWLQTRLFTIGPRNVEICQILWYFTSFAGIVWLMIVFQQWQRKASPATTSTKTGWGKALLVALLFFPIEVGHHFIGGPIGLAITAIGTFSVFLFVLFTMHHGSRVSPNPAT